MTKVEEMLNSVSGRLAILELATHTLSDSNGMQYLHSVREKNWCSDNYILEISNFLGETLRLSMDCQAELELTLKSNVSESSEKKGA